MISRRTKISESKDTNKSVLSDLKLFSEPTVRVIEWSVFGDVNLRQNIIRFGIRENEKGTDIDLEDVSNHSRSKWKTLAEVTEMTNRENHDSNHQGDCAQANAVPNNEHL